MKNTVAWIQASRPKTLIAAFLPVCTAWVFAVHSSSETQHSLFIWALLVALCIQIATNFWNDYFDDKKGSDTEERLGPRRLLQQKMATRNEVKKVAILFNVASFLFALPIFLERGWSLLPLGILCVALTIAYTGGPFPLAYLGLGEIFVVLFFGWVATAFSYYVGTGHWSREAEVLGLQVGALSSVLITINNLRDFREDKKSNKKTLVVIFGKNFGYFLLAAELLVPYVLNFYWIQNSRLTNNAIVFLALPLAAIIFVNMFKSRKANQQLAFSALHALLFLIFWSIGLLRSQTGGA